MEKNKVTIKGQLGAKPELYEKENGSAYARLSVAINNYRQTEDGAYEKTSTDWIPVTCFEKPGNLATRVTTLNKGDLVRVHGRLSSSSYVKDGKNTKSLNIIANEIEKIEPLVEKGSAGLMNQIDKVLQDGQNLQES